MVLCLTHDVILSQLQEKTFSVVAVQPQWYFVVAQQPDIINTIPLTNEEVSHSMSLMTISNTVVEDKNSAVSRVTSASNFECTPDNIAVATSSK